MEDRNGVQRLSPLSHSQAPIVQKGGQIKALLTNILLITANIVRDPEVFYQFIAVELVVVPLFIPKFSPESKGLRVEDLVSAPFSFSV